MLRHWATYIRLDTAAWRRHFGGLGSLAPSHSDVRCWCLHCDCDCDCGMGEDDQSGRRGWAADKDHKVQDVWRFKERSVTAGGGYG